MRRSRPPLCLLALTILLPLAVPSSEAAAQHIYLDTNGDGVHTSADAIAPTGATTVDIWLTTSQNRDGSPAVCSSGSEPLDLRGYQVVIGVENGTVTWGPYANSRPEFTLDLGVTKSAAEFATGFGSGGSSLSPGLYKLGSVPVTVASGTPSLSFLQSSTAVEIRTSFDSSCLGVDQDNSIKLGVDFQDADGAPYGGDANDRPVLAAIADVSMGEGASQDVPLTATDADGDALTFSLESGPAYASVQTLSAGTGTATGVVHLAPGYTDAGDATVTVSAADALLADRKSFQVHVANTNRLPSLVEPDSVMMREGEIKDRSIQASDADGDLMEFFLVSGPGYLTVTTVFQEAGVATGILHLAPGYADEGMVIATVGVRDVRGGIDTKPFMIMVRNHDRDAVMTLPGPITSAEGEPILFTARASDPDGDMVMFEAEGLPAGSTFLNLMNNTAVFRWTPGYDQAGTYTLTIHGESHVGDPVTGTVSITITDVTSAVALAQPLEMTVTEGETAEQILSAYDASGDPLTFSLVTGPAFATVSTTSPGTGLASGRLRLAPGPTDAGVFAVTVSASDGTTAAERTLRVDVIDADLAPGAAPFQPPFITMGVGLVPHTVTMGDINLDGKLDLATANLGTHTVSVFLALGGATFDMRMELPTLLRPHTVSIRDLNGDGKPDLSVTHVGSNSIGVFLGRGDGTFEARRDVPTPGSPLFLSVHDFNRDGKMDIAYTNQTTGALGMLLGAGDGTFTRSGEFPTGAGAHGMAIGDVNGDGMADGVVANTAAVSVLLGRGDGTFDAKIDFTTSAPHTVAMGDLNEDGRQDLIVSNLNTGKVSFVYGSGDGHFHVDREVETGVLIHASTIGDVDLDGHLDVLSANQGTSAISVFMGRGANGFAPHVNLPVGEGAHSIAIGDLDQDGMPDVASSNIVANTITILINKLDPARAARAMADVTNQVLVPHAARPFLRVGVEPVAESFALEQIDLASVELVSEGTGSVDRIHASTARPITVADRDRNGIPEGYVSFARSDLMLLFDGIRGKATVPLTLEGRLSGGGRFEAAFTLTVIGTGAPIRQVAVTPNPLNPSGVVAFTLKSAARATVSLYDARGRMVRQLARDQLFAQGMNEIPFDGRGERGRVLASGVYFVRVEAGGEVAAGRFTLLK